MLTHFWRISGYWLWFAWRRTLLARDSGKRLPAQQLPPLYRSRWQQGWVYLFVYISKPEVEFTKVLSRAHNSRHCTESGSSGGESFGLFTFLNQWWNSQKSSGPTIRAFHCREAGGSGGESFFVNNFFAKSEVEFTKVLGLKLSPLYRSRWQRGWVFLFVYNSKPVVEFTRVLGPQWHWGRVLLVVYISLLNQRWN